MERYDAERLQVKDPELFDVLYWKYLHCFEEEMERAKNEEMLEDVGSRMYEIYRYVTWNIGFHAFVLGFYEGEAAKDIPPKHKSKKGESCPSRKAKAKKR